MANTSVEYKNFKCVTNKIEKEDDVSSGYLQISRRNSTASGDIDEVSASLQNPVREKSIPRQNSHKLKDTNIEKQTLKHDTDEYSGTEICPVCVQKENIFKEATHFCKDCDRRGRYLCQTCIKEHYIWHGKNHVIVSLSVDRETNSDWQQQQGQIQLEHGNPEFQYVDSWIQKTTADGDYEYGQPNQQDMALFKASKSTSETNYESVPGETESVRINQLDKNWRLASRDYSLASGTLISRMAFLYPSLKATHNSGETKDKDYSWANTVTTVSLRSRMALPNTSQKTMRNSWEVSKNGTILKQRSNFLGMRNMQRRQRPQMPLPDTPNLEDVYHLVDTEVRQPQSGLKKETTV